MKDAREKNVAVLGTARARRNWPPQEMRDVDDTRFNTLYFMNDKNNFRIFRWLDNGEVYFASNLHTGTGSVVSDRKKPRETQTNRSNVQRVFGSEGVMRMRIPKLVDDYNHWMNGVDKADQLIAYYKPKLRCRRTWMPIFIHCLDIIRANSFAIAKAKGQSSVNKTFILDLVASLNSRADELESRAGTRATAAAALVSPTPSSAKKKTRQSSTNPKLPAHRLAPGQHAVGTRSQSYCKMCQYLHAVARAQGTSLPWKIKKPGQYCIACNDHLCKDHFEEWHKKE